nr:sensor histidine kinase [Lihuaxuella thermophila]
MRIKWTLEARMIGWISLLLLVVVLLLGGTFYLFMVKYIENQVGKRALSVAQTIAEMPEIQRGFAEKEPWRTIQPLVEKVRSQTGAEFIVVGNRQGIRYSHPFPDRIGKSMVGGDNDRALLRGESYISKAIGSLGPSLRGKAPITNERGEIIGIVSVGFLLSDIDQLAHAYFTSIFFVLMLVFFIGFLGAAWLAKRVKRSIFGLEPEEISALYQERHAVLESVREGIIVVNATGNVSLINRSAVKILELPPPPKIVGRPVQDFLPHTRMLDVLETGQAELDREVNLNGKELVVSRLPIRDQSRVIGAVASFRLKSEIDQVGRELSQVKQYVEALRAQTHEFKNTLYTISGLIQLESYQEAIELIHRESEAHQDHVVWVMQKFPDPRLGAILIGFYNRARELKIDFMIGKESCLQKIPPSISHSALVSILGNLITNAFEAVLDEEESRRKVRLFVSDLGDSLWFEVEDAGPGVPDDIIPAIFERGFSTKKAPSGERRGFGLAKVKELVSELGGRITIDTGEWGGAVFAVSLPKERGSQSCREQKPLMC